MVRSTCWIRFRWRFMRGNRSKIGARIRCSCATWFFLFSVFSHFHCAVAVQAGATDGLTSGVHNRFAFRGNGNCLEYPSRRNVARCSTYLRCAPFVCCLVSALESYCLFWCPCRATENICCTICLLPRLWSRVGLLWYPPPCSWKYLFAFFFVSKVPCLILIYWCFVWPTLPVQPRRACFGLHPAMFSASRKVSAFPICICVRSLSLVYSVCFLFILFVLVC